MTRAEDDKEEPAFRTGECLQRREGNEKMKREEDMENKRVTWIPSLTLLIDIFPSYAGKEGQGR
jgi:hypothetical protein